MKLREEKSIYSANLNEEKYFYSLITNGFPKKGF